MLHLGRHSFLGGNMHKRSERINLVNLLLSIFGGGVLMLVLILLSPLLLFVWWLLPSDDGWRYE